MGKLWHNKYKIRTNYDTFQPEVSIKGVWIPLEIIKPHMSVMGDVDSIEYIREQYGDEPADAILEELENPTECDHNYIFDGIEDGFRRYKCRCGQSYLDERAN